MKTIALIVAAGRGVRFGGDVPKQFRLIHDRPLLAWTISQFDKCDCIDEIYIVVGEEFLLYVNEKILNYYNFKKTTKIIKGGAIRKESVYNGLKAMPISTSFVAVHDGARPIIDPADIDRVIECAQANNSAILARQVSDTIKRVEAGHVIATIDRSRLYRAETPQVFQYDLLMSAHEKLAGKTDITDDASMIEQIGFKVKIVEPTQPNLKVTTEDDINVARLYLEERLEA